MSDLDSVLRVIRELNERPEWKWPKEHRDDLRGERALPLLCLIGEPERTEAVAETLGERLSPSPLEIDETPARLIPFTSVDAKHVSPTTDEQGRPLLPLLNHLVHHLSLDRYGAGREIPFHTFRLVDWLTRHTASTLGRDQQAPLRSKLLDWYAPSPKEGDDAEPIAPIVEAVVPDKALALSKAMPRLLSRLGRWAWLRGLRGGEPRWLMRQRFAGTKHSASFLRFARRLTVDHREHENPDQIKLLLVHAFLRDLRLFYGTRTWRLRRWRRTAYLVVVLRGITEHDGGWELLRLINDVRNQTGEHDPLLVVATASDIPDDLDLTPTPVREIDDALAAWKRELPWKRQQFRPTARFIAVRLDGPLVPGRASRGRTRGREHWEPRKVPLFARKWTVVVAVMSLLAGASASVAAAWPRTVSDPCGVAAFPMAAATWLPETGECVGYSAGGYVFGSTKLGKVQKALFEQNRLAEDRHRGNGRRPLISLVYFAELTHPDSQEGTDDAVAEEMTGLLIQQARNNTVGNSTSVKPLLRIVVANGGHEMRHARRAVDEFIAPLADRNPEVLGVVGGGRTVAQTESAVGALGAHGIPMVATTLTGHTMPRLSPLYFQMVAGNGDQARLITEYAADTGRSVTVYHPDLERNPDPYLQSLHGHFAAVVGGHPSVQLKEWHNPATVEVTCRSSDIAFYAGRETGFSEFLDHVLSTCPAAARPTVIGDDAITRFIAEGRSGHSAHFAGVPLSYVSLANRIVLAGRTCVAEGSPAQGSDPDTDWQLDNFCAGLHGLYRSGSDRPAAWKAFGAELAEDDGTRRWTGERVGVAYDAAGLFVFATIQNLDRVISVTDPPGPNRAAVAQEFRELDCSDTRHVHCYKGVSGRIDFRAGRDGSNRPLAILTIHDLDAVDANPTCTYRFQDTAPCPRVPGGTR